MMVDLLGQRTMAHICCQECGKKYAMSADMAGKKVRCQCGAQFRIRGTASTQPEPPLPHLTCPHCQQEVLPNWKACPACGQRLQGVGPSITADQPSMPQPAP